MPDYANGKIYKITSGDKTYIGSTCEPTLARRLAKHLGDYKKWKQGKRGSITSFPLIETGQYEITLVELCPCGSKDELRARERFHIENTVCVNKLIPGRTAEEYEQTCRNKEERNQWKREDRKLHPEKYKEQDDRKYAKHRDAIIDRVKKYREAKKS
jgi:hypothetical protein